MMAARAPQPTRCWRCSLTTEAGSHAATMTSRPSRPRMTTGMADQEANVPYPEMRNAQVRTKTPASDRKALVASGVPPASRLHAGVQARAWTSSASTAPSPPITLSIGRGLALEDLDVAVRRGAHQLVK